MAAVSHPNLEVIFSVESWRSTPLLVVEYLSGGSLADRLQGRTLEVQEATRISTELCDAVACLHRMGILHRDIKPANIGFTGTGEVKLLDFGLACMLEAAAADFLEEENVNHIHTSANLNSLAFTNEGQIVGTLSYLSPEGVNGASPTPAVDLWALSLVFYEMLAGRNPFPVDDAGGMLKRILLDDMPDVREYAPHVPEFIAMFLKSALSRDSDRRPSNAEGWNAGLRRAASHFSVN